MKQNKTKQRLKQALHREKYTDAQEAQGKTIREK